MIHRPLRAFLICIITILAMNAASAQTRAGVSGQRIPQLLEQSGYRYSKAGDNVWTIKFTGKSLSEFQVLVTSAQGIVVLGVVVAKKDEIKLTPQLMHNILKLTHNLDRAKIGFDDDDD